MTNLDPKNLPLPVYAGGTKAITFTPVVGKPRLNYPEMYIPGNEDLEVGEMRVTVLGSGNPWTTRAQASASILVEVGNQERDIFAFDLVAGSLANYASLKLRSTSSIKCSLSLACGYTETSSPLIRTDFMVAVTVFAVLVPSAMAYGELAGVDPVAGLYVALGAMVMYALFGSSLQVVMGPEATSAIITAAAVAPLAGGDPARYAALAAMTAILVGVISILASIAKLGFITDFLSKPILVGYILGATLIVIGSQLGKMFGISLESDEFFRQVAELISRLDETHILTFVIGVVCITALLLIRKINRAIPGPLIVVVGAILASVFFDLESLGVKVVGPVTPGLPSISIPIVSLQDIITLLPAALALTVLIYADEILTARVFANKHGQKINSNQEFMAIGMANIGAGILSGFPAALSASRTAVSDQMGGKSQWVGLIAAVLTIIFLLFLTPILAPLPTVALGAIIIVASIGLIDIPAFRFLKASPGFRVLAGSDNHA